MSDPIAYLNGKYIPVSQAAISVNDAGFVMGTTVTEQLRSFSGRLFRVEQHLGRLFRSLEIIGVDPGLSQENFVQIAEKIVQENHSLLASGDDLGLAMFVTPGPYPTLAQRDDSGPTVCLHSYPLPFELWAQRYHEGEALAVSQVRQVSASAWPRELKCRSRMHYYLADREARQIDPQARALLLDEDGFITEATTASVLIYREGVGLIAPLKDRVLPGISAAMIEDLAASLEIPVVHQNLLPEQVADADEVMLASTTCCILPVVRFNRQPIGAGRPGKIYQSLLSAWSEAAGIDIAQQAVQLSRR